MAVEQFRHPAPDASGIDMHEAAGTQTFRQSVKLADDFPPRYRLIFTQLGHRSPPHAG